MSTYLCFRNYKIINKQIEGSHYLTLSLTVPLYNIFIDHVEDVIDNDNKEDKEDEEENDEENNNENDEENDGDEKWNQIVKKAAKKCKVKLL
ncbi:hypothetical protein RhiirA5_439018, partial [Rhizophagus irregularis]